MNYDGRGNVENDENRARHTQLKTLVADCDDLDARCRRILGALRESWWGHPYTEDRDEPVHEPSDRCNPLDSFRRQRPERAA